MAKHTEETIHRTLLSEWPSVERREINHGLQFTLPEGTKVNFFPSTGKVNVQGKDCAEKKRAEQLLQSVPTVAANLGVATAQNPALLPPEKIFISGYSQGGLLTLAVALTSQYKLGGFIPLCGLLPR